MNLFAKLCVVFLVLIQNLSCAEKGRFKLEKNPLAATEGSCIEIKCNIEKDIKSDGAHWFWMKDAKWKSNDFDATVIYSTNNTARPVSPDFAGRVKYIGSLKWGSYSSSEKCSVIICKLNKTDSGNYSVRYVRGDFKWKTETEVNLTVTENPCLITFEKPPPIKESQSVTLTCSTLRSCLSNLQIKSVAQLHPSTPSGPPGNDKQKSTTVSFTASWQDDGREFSCQTHDNTDPYLIQNISLTVEYAPRDVSAKMSSENIREGQSLTLTCSANGRPVPTFTWFRDEENVSSKSEWDIKQINDSQSGVYYCEAKNTGGTKKSNTLVVNVTYVPEVVVNMTAPSRPTIVRGDKMTLTCEVTRSKPQPSTYYWSKNGRTIGWKKSYYVEHIQPENSGSYTCSATNLVGTGTSASHEINVHYMPRNTRISNKEHLKEVKVDRSLTLDCITEAYPDPNRYSWYRYNQSKQTKSDWKPGLSFKKSLTLQRVQREDEACYTCNATNDIGTGDNSDPLCIRVLYRPTSPMLSMDTEDTEVTEGRLITISCSVESYPTSKLTFRKTSTSDPHSLEKQFLQAGNSNMLQHTFNVTSTHTGFYTCNADNSEGSSKSEQRQLVVKYHPEDVRVEAQPGLVVNENMTLTLLCRAQSHPLVTSVTWTKVTDGKKTIISGPRISFTVSPSDRGLYSCSATNEIGTGNSLQVEVKVKYAPKVTNIIRAAEQQHPDGKRSVVLSCSSQSYPHVSEYTWYRRIQEEERNIKVSGSQNYTVYSDQPGLYYCIAKNEISEKMSDPIQLFVDRGLMKYLLLALIILLVIVLLVFVYRRKRRKSIQHGTTNTSSCSGSLGCWNRSRGRNLMNEPVMTEPFRSRDDLLPDQRCRPNGQRSQPPPDSTPASNIDTVYCTVNLPAGKQGPSAQKPVRQRGGQTDDEALNYASLHFENKKKKKQAKTEESVVYAKVCKQKQPKKKEQEILGDYENVSAVDAAKAPNPMKSDTDTSEDEVELNYSQVSFKAKPGHKRACRDSSSDTSSDTSSDSSTSDDGETQYSQVKV